MELDKILLGDSYPRIPLCSNLGNSMFDNKGQQMGVILTNRISLSRAYLSLHNLLLLIGLTLNVCHQLSALTTFLELILTLGRMDGCTNPVLWGSIVSHLMAVNVGLNFDNLDLALITKTKLPP